MLDAGFPCVGARSALNRGRLRFALFDALGDPATAEPSCRALYTFMPAAPEARSAGFRQAPRET